MNSLTTTSITMSSIEIAELTGKQIKHVNRDISVMFNELEIDGSRFGHVYKDSLNRDKKCYALDKRLTNILITGYSIKLRAAVIDRLNELESGMIAIPQTFSEALRALADKSDDFDKLANESKLLEIANNGLNKTLEVIKPAAEYGQKILNTTTLFTPTNVGQELGLSAVRLNKILRAQLNIIRRGTGDTDYEVKAKYLNEGLVDHITTPYKNTLGENKLKRSLRWTRKGFDWLCDNKDSILDPAKKSLKIISKPILYKGL